VIVWRLADAPVLLAAYPALLAAPELAVLEAPPAVLLWPGLLSVEPRVLTVGLDGLALEAGTLIFKSFFLVADIWVSS